MLPDVPDGHQGPKNPIRAGRSPAAESSNGTADVASVESVERVTAGHRRTPTWRGWDTLLMAPLQGRGSELSVLRDLTAAVGEGAGGVVVVEGAAGIGKSRLLAEGCSVAESEGLLVASASADELDQVTPWGVLVRALSSSDPALLTSEELEEFGALSDRRLAVIDRMRAELEDVSSRRPLLIALDDLQWADAATLLALGLLPVQLFSYPIGWLLALRPLPVRAAVDGLLERLDATGATRVHPGPLEPSAAIALARDIAGSDGGSDLEELIADAEGNPFYIIEVAKARPSNRPRRERAVAPGLPDAVRAAVSQHLRSLSDDARQLLRVASVLGREFSVAEVAAMRGVSASELLPSIEEALRAEILIESVAGLAFRHDLLRQAVYQSLPGSALEALHRDAGHALRSTGASAVRIAGQLAVAAVPGDEAATEAIHQAVRELTPASPKAAADLALRLLELVDESDDRRLEMVRSAASALMLAGRTDEAVALAERHLGAHRPAPELEAGLQLQLRSRWLFVRFEPYPNPVPDHLLRNPAVDPGVMATLIALEQTPAAWYRAPDEAYQSLANALRIVAEHGNALEFATVAQLQAIDSAIRGRVEQALAEAQAAFAIARSLEGPAAIPVHRSSLAAQLAGCGRLADALAMLQAVAADAGAEERIATATRDRWTRTAILLNHGRLDDAHAEALPDIELDVQLGYSGRVGVPLATVVETSLRRGDSDEARATLARYGPLAPKASLIHFAAALVADAQRNPEQVAEALAPILAQLESGCFEVVVGQPHRLGLLVHIARRARHDPAIQTFVQAASTLAGQNPNTPALLAAAAHTRGLVERDVTLLRDAVELAADSELRLLEAAAREDFGEMLAGDTYTEDAIKQLESAYEFYVFAGAHHDSARVRSALRRLGVRKRQTAVARPQHGWESLTRSERVVVDLVARGMTNREAASELFLSPDTINTHLRHAFAKLGIRSRVELARMAAQREQVPS
jgi:DNA-binding CsgD family transcriptional regulator